MGNINKSMALFAEMNPEPVFRVDGEGKILNANIQMKELAGSDHVINKHIQKIIPSISKVDLKHIIQEDKIEKHQFVWDNKFYRFIIKGISKYDFCQFYGTDITDKVSLQKKADSMALFAKMNPAPVFRFNLMGDIIESNPKAEKLFQKGYVEKVNIYKLFSWLDKEKVQNIIYNEKVESFVQYLDNQVYKFELRGIRDFLSVQGYGSDITEIVNTHYENEKLSKAIQQSSNSVMVTDTNGNIEFVNKAFEKISGYLKEEVIGKNPRFLKTNYHSQETYKALWETISNGKVWKGEFYNRRKDGTHYWEEASITPITDSDGEIKNYISVKEDVTEKKKAREEAHAMALFAQMNPEPVLRFDRKGIILQANPVANKTLGRENIEGMQIKELFEELNYLDINEFIDNNQVETIDIEKQDKVFRIIIKGIKDIEVTQLYGSDITERVKAERRVRQQKEDIDGSIQYASRIQNAIIPKDDILDQYTQDHFILFKPRDVVSGDFYWMTEKDNKLVVVAADSTGHGVPGAFMSMLGISFLNQIVNSSKSLIAASILDQLREYVKSTLAQSGGKTDDGMDLSLVIFDKENMKMQFAGAYNHLYLFRNEKMEILKADRMPIGNFIKDHIPFTNHEVDIQQNDTIYLLSDGYPDQFNTSMKKKYTIKRLKKDFAEIHQWPMKKQREYLDENFEKYKENHWQIDDVLVMGIRI